MAAGPGQVVRTGRVRPRSRGRGALPRRPGTAHSRRTRARPVGRTCGLGRHTPAVVRGAPVRPAGAAAPDRANQRPPKPSSPPQAASGRAPGPAQPSGQHPVPRTTGTAPSCRRPHRPRTADPGKRTGHHDATDAPGRQRHRPASRTSCARPTGPRTRDSTTGTRSGPASAPPFGPHPWQSGLPTTRPAGRAGRCRGAPAGTGPAPGERRRAAPGSGPPSRCRPCRSEPARGSRRSVWGRGLSCRTRRSRLPHAHANYLRWAYGRHHRYAVKPPPLAPPSLLLLLLSLLPPHRCGQG